MNNLPLLEILTDKNVINNIFSELMSDDIDECLNKMNAKYNKFLLSSFDTILSNDDKRIALLSDSYFMKSQESKYINFFSEIFEANNKCCIVEVNLTNFDYDNLLSYLNIGIDIRFQYILLHQYINFFNNKNMQKRYFYIKDKDLLTLFVIFSLREQSLSQYFLFPRDEICIFSNYDCLLPIFFKNDNIVKNYREITEKLEIYLI